MKNNTRRILLALVLAFAMILSMATVTAFAADGTAVYLDPGDDWKSDNARFAVYYWTNESDNGWVDMTDTGDGVYKGVIPAGYKNCIFVRMNPDTDYNSWDNKWNQTVDLIAVADDTYTITDPWSNLASGTWASGASTDGGNGGSGEVADPSGASTFTVAGVAGLCGEEWNPAYAANDMVYNKTTGLYEKTFTGIAAGTYEFKVAADHGWDRSWGDPVNGVGQYGTDFQIILEAEQNVTVTFNPITGQVGCLLSASTGADPSLSDSTEDRTVVLKNSAGWDEVYIYFWSKSTGEYSAWPGELMEQGADGLYYYTIPEGYWGVVFSNGNGGEGNQTINLVVPSETNNYYDNDDLSSNWQRNPNAVEPDNGDNTDDGSKAPAKMTFLQKMAKALLLFLRKIEGFFKNIFVKK